jgi:hypothetical protein
MSTTTAELGMGPVQSRVVSAPSNGSCVSVWCLESGYLPPATAIAGGRSGGSSKAPTVLM